LTVEALRRYIDRLSAEFALHRYEKHGKFDLQAVAACGECRRMDAHIATMQRTMIKRSGM